VDHAVHRRRRLHWRFTLSGSRWRRSHGGPFLRFQLVHALFQPIDPLHHLPHDSGLIARRGCLGQGGPQTQASGDAEQEETDNFSKAVPASHGNPILAEETQSIRQAQEMFLILNGTNDYRQLQTVS